MNARIFSISIRWIFLSFFSISALSRAEAQLLPICDSNNHWGYCDENGKMIVPFLYKWATNTKNGVACVGVFKEPNEYSCGILFVGENGSVSRDKNLLSSYYAPLIECVNTNGVYFLTHKNGQTESFPNMEWMCSFEDGVTVCRTKDGACGFSSNPFEKDSWKFLSTKPRSFLFYDACSKVITLIEKDSANGNESVNNYLNLNGEHFYLLEMACHRYLKAGFCVNGLVPVVKAVGGKKKWGALSLSGVEIVECRYDYIGALEGSRFYCCERKCDDGSIEAVFVDDKGEIKTKVVYDEFWNGCGSTGDWFPVIIKEAKCWINVNDKTMLKLVNDIVVKSTLQ